ncbi:ABC transporter permease subunit [Pseudoneobacillus sp. C159]
MKLVSQLLGLFLMWIFVTLVLVLIVLLPRGFAGVDLSLSNVEIQKQYEERMTTFSWDDYKENIVRTYRQVVEQKSLGQTVHLLSVEYEVWRYFKKSLIIFIPSIFISILFGIAKGIYDFTTKKRRFSLLGERTTSTFLAVPDFFIILSTQILIMVLFTYGFPHIDVYGSETWSNKILGVLFLSMYSLFYIARITTTVLEEQSGQDYIRTALSKGVSLRKVIWRHMLGNCWVKIFSHMNTIVLYLLSNLFIVEYLLGYRGGAYRFYKAFEIKRTFTPLDLMNIDTRVVIGFIIVFTFIVFISHLLSKIASFYFLAKEGGET